MRIKKKGLALWLALFLGVSSLSGCGGGDDGMTQLSEKGAEILNSTEEDSDTDVEPLKQKTKLPEDGIITQAQMETIAGKDEKYYFTDCKNTATVSVSAEVLYLSVVSLLLRSSRRSLRLHEPDYLR